MCRPPLTRPDHEEPAGRPWSTGDPPDQPPDGDLLHSVRPIHVSLSAISLSLALSLSFYLSLGSDSLCFPHIFFPPLGDSLIHCSFIIVFVSVVVFLNHGGECESVFLEEGPFLCWGSSTRAKTIFSTPFSLAAFQEFLCKNRLIAKTHLAVETSLFIYFLISDPCYSIEWITCTLLSLLLRFFYVYCVLCLVCLYVVCVEKAISLNYAPSLPLGMNKVI